MTEHEVREHIRGLAEEYTHYNPLISHGEAVILHEILSKIPCEKNGE